MAFKEDYLDNDLVPTPSINAIFHALNTTARVYLGQTDPSITESALAGTPAVWFQTDGTGKVIDIKVGTL